MTRQRKAKILKVKREEDSRRRKVREREVKRVRRENSSVLEEKRGEEVEMEEERRREFIKAATSGLEELKDGDFDSIYRELMSSSTAQLTALRLPWAVEEDGELASLEDPSTQWEPPSPSVLLPLIREGSGESDASLVDTKQKTEDLPLKQIMDTLLRKGKEVARVEEVEALAIGFAQRGEVEHVVEVLRTLYPRGLSEQDQFVGALIEKVIDAEGAVWKEKEPPSLEREGAAEVSEWVEGSKVVRLWTYLCNDGMVTSNVLETYIKTQVSHSQTTLFLPHILQVLLSPPSTVSIPTLPTYSSALTALLSPSVPLTHRSTFWDLYAHLRFVAHPSVNEEVYATMIAGCSTNSGEGLERANDLWTEMEDAGIVPGTKSYTALMRNNARAIFTIGKKELYDRDQFWGPPEEAKKMFARNLNCYFEALRLLQKMISEGVPPDRATFGEILEAALRMGDLERARWVLLKMVEGSQVRRQAILETLQREGLDASEWDAALVDPLAPTEDEVAKVLSAYAMFTVPIPGPNKSFVFREDEATLEGRPQVPLSESERKVAEALDPPVTDGAVKGGKSAGRKRPKKDFPGPIPTKHLEVLAEAYGLLRRCLGPKGQEILQPSQSHLQIKAFISDTRLETDEDWEQWLNLGSQKQSEQDQASGPPEEYRPIPALAQVKINSKLLCSYLHVYARHSTLESCVGIWRDLYPRLGIVQDSRAFVIMLRKCLISGGNYRLHVASKIFRDFRQRTEGSNKTLQEWPAKDVSMIWGAMIELLAKSNQISTAGKLLDQFYSLYPPTDLIKKVRTIIEYHHSPTSNVVPLVRLSDSQYPETQPSSRQVLRNLAPFLEFSYVQLFHHRLMKEGPQALQKLRSRLDEYFGATREVQNLLDSMFDGRRSDKERKGLRALEQRNVDGGLSAEDAPDAEAMRRLELLDFEEPVEPLEGAEEMEFADGDKAGEGRVLNWEEEPPKEWDAAAEMEFEDGEKAREMEEVTENDGRKGEGSEERKVQGGH
ncbi:hypothetical protein BT69DRAFT_741621 [Atractiella rhizophila]|nr:hypothetical protein BT69DRAFT_741621 [Atractiella rhizophila]